MGEGTTGVPGLRYVPGWVAAGEQGELLGAVEEGVWSGELRRRVQHYGYRYDYGRRALGDGAPAPEVPGWARELARRLVAEGLMDGEAEQVIVNEYLPGQGISAHVDCLPCFGPVIAAVSLGSGCVMDFSNPADGAKVAVRLEPGSVMAMTGPARSSWRHAIAARKTDPGPGGRVPRGRRVSLTFRTMLRAG